MSGRVLMVGLTGGIGAGKSEVARCLADLGAVVVDADALAREVVAPGTPGLAEVVEAFGGAVLAPDGALDRAAMARLVFADPQARRRLEGIVHPRVRARTAELVAAAPPDAVVVNDVPLLVEAGLAGGFDLVLVVLAAEPIRLERLTHGRGMPVEEARSRIAAQAGDDQRRAVADVVIVNDGTREQLREAVERVWRERMVPYVRRPGEARTGVIGGRATGGPDTSGPDTGGPGTAGSGTAGSGKAKGARGGR